MSGEAGVNFRLGAAGRSSTAAATGVLAAAVRGYDDALAEDLGRVSDWRHTYPGYFERVVVAEAQSAAAALGIATQGLAAARQHFGWVDAQGVDHPLSAAFEQPGELDSAVIRGSDHRVRELVVPYRGQQLRGLSLLRQLDDWVHRGITEPSFAQAVGAIVQHPEWLDLRDRTVAMIGAASQMGPFVQLMSWGANVAAVDLPLPAVWSRLVGLAKESAGVLRVPIARSRPGGDRPVENRPVANDHPAALIAAGGADLLTEVAPVLRWLLKQPGPMTIGNYGYLDGALFVRLSMAFDVLIEALAEPRHDLSVAYLATPSDAFLVPIQAVDMAQQRHHGSSAAAILGRSVGALSGGRWFRPNYTDRTIIETPTERFGIVNAFIVAQGPNYAFAKRLQRWRMMLARHQGLLSSVHIAPPTRTRSVHSNPMMAQRQRLTAHLGIETFDADTVEALAAAVLVHDLRNPSSPANPATPLGHPHEAFMFAANPGGRWRVPFDVSSAVPVLRELDQVQHAATRAIRRLRPGRD